MLCAWKFFFYKRGKSSNFFTACIFLLGFYQGSTDYPTFIVSLQIGGNPNCPKRVVRRALTLTISIIPFSTKQLANFLSSPSSIEIITLIEILKTEEILTILKLRKKLWIEVKYYWGWSSCQLVGSYLNPNRSITGFDDYLMQNWGRWRTIRPSSSDPNGQSYSQSGYKLDGPSYWKCMEHAAYCQLDF